MRYVSIDIETTGLNPEYCSILEIGAILEDTSKNEPREKLPSFHAYIWKDTYIGEAYALAMNAHILKRIVELEKTKDPLLMLSYSVMPKFKDFLVKNNIETAIVAGKNFGSFDLQFLNKLSGWNAIKIAHRTLDPSMYYVDFSKDIFPPDLKTCKKRAGLPELVTHEALDDAWDVISLIRAKNIKE